MGRRSNFAWSKHNIETIFWKNFRDCQKCCNSFDLVKNTSFDLVKTLVKTFNLGKNSGFDVVKFDVVTKSSRAVIFKKIFYLILLLHRCGFVRWSGELKTTFCKCQRQRAALLTVEELECWHQLRTANPRSPSRCCSGPSQRQTETKWNIVVDAQRGSGGIWNSPPPGNFFQKTC